MKFIKYLLPIIVLGLSPVQSVSGLTPIISTQCPVELQLTENLRSGAYNGRYHPYTRGIVTQAHILQKHLNRLGFSSGVEDGKLGPISTGAIMRMQTSLGTKPDGIVGPNTRAVLNNSCEPSDFPVPCGVGAPGCALPSRTAATIQTQSAESINENSAYLRADIQINESETADIYFVYGTSKSQVEKASRKTSFARIDQSGERLQKLFVGGVYHNTSFSKKFSNLRSNEKYYFTACVDSKEGPFECSSAIKSFETNKENSNNNFKNPDVQTRSPFLDMLGIRGQAWQLIFEGHSEHNDAINIKTFFVYGHNTESLDIESNYSSYNEINTNSGIKKTNYSHSPDTNSTATFTKSVTPVIEDLNQPNYFSACIEYRDEDNDTQLECGNSRRFNYSSTLENSQKQARDAAAKAKLSQRRADIELYYIDNNTYDDVFPYITNLQLNTGSSYSLIYQSREDTYTQYTALQTRDDLFCTDSTGYAGYTSSVLFGISCNH